MLGIVLAIKIRNFSKNCLDTIKDIVSLKSSVKRHFASNHFMQSSVGLNFVIFATVHFCKL